MSWYRRGIMGDPIAIISASHQAWLTKPPATRDCSIVTHEATSVLMRAPREYLEQSLHTEQVTCRRRHGTEATGDATGVGTVSSRESDWREPKSRAISRSIDRRSLMRWRGVIPGGAGVGAFRIPAAMAAGTLPRNITRAWTTSPANNRSAAPIEVPSLKDAISEHFLAVLRWTEIRHDDKGSR